MSAQLGLFEDGRVYQFDGRTYDPELDSERLSTQLGQVYRLMSDGAWRTLREIAESVGAPEASVSARLRDLRKERFGRQAVERQRMGEGGTWRYRLAREGTRR